MVLASSDRDCYRGMVGFSPQNRRIVTETLKTLNTQKKLGSKFIISPCIPILPCFGACILLFCINLLVVPDLTKADTEEKSLPTTTVTISPEVKIEAELAYTDELRMKGLMFRDSLAADSGMLFIFPYLDQHSFWMKNTLISLDIIWLNERKEIVYITTAIPCTADPCTSYVPMQKAKYVLEVNEGFAKKHALKLGARLEFRIPSDIERIANK